MKRKTYLPKPVLKGIVADIKRFVHDNEGRFMILEVAREIPHEIKKHLLEELSLFYDEDLAVFFKLFLEEYDEEFKPVCVRALNKYRMAGCDVDNISFREGTFYKAYASLSRQSGSITLEVAWQTGSRCLDIECFYLSYGTEGIHSFMLLGDMPARRYEAERRQALDMVELDLKEVCLLVRQAYEVNKRNMTRPATGRFLYKKYLDTEIEVGEEEVYSLTCKLSPELMPTQLINSFFYALKQKDYTYIASVLDRQKLPLKKVKKLFAPVIIPGNLLLEAKADEAYLEGDMVKVSGHLCLMDKEGIYRYDYVFVVDKDENLKGKINDIQIADRSRTDAYLGLKPDKKAFYCLVYEIADIDELFIWLEGIRLLKVVGELPRGIHLRISPLYDEEEWDNGISFLGPGEVDIVINGDELVIICLDDDFLNELDEEIERELEETLEFKGRYEVDLMAVYSYIEGQYASFEDIAVSREEEKSFSGGMRFLSARYLVKNYRQVYDFLALVSDHFYDLNDYCIFYRLEKDEKEPLFLAEYILDEEYLTVSAFGEDDLSRLRDDLAEKVCDYLEFVGIETRREGLFAVLSPEVKRSYPQLEMVLKEFYLNKWVKSSLPLLKGMTPREAFQSPEGQRMLWDMFKQMKKSENSWQNKSCIIKFRDYMSKLENKWEKIK